MIIFLMVLSLFHVGSSQPDAYSAIESSTCGQLTATPEQIAKAEELFPSQRIYGGREVTFAGEWYPWAVEIKTTLRRTIAGQVQTIIRLCSGSILNRRWVISAAHCFFRVEPNPSTRRPYNARINLTDIDINFGMFGRPRVRTNQPLIVAKPIKVVEHRQYLVGPDVLRTRNEYDIALVKLDHELEFTVITSDHGTRRNRFYINSICLPRNNPDFTGKIHISAGFGRIGLVINQNRSLRMMEIPLTYYDHCWELLNRFKPAFIYTLNNDKTWRDFVSNDNSDNPYYREYRNRIICSSILLATDGICMGDSGGPLMVQRPSGDGRFELTGISRSGSEERNGTFNKIVTEKLGYENRDLANTYYEIYSTIFPCGHQPQFINTYQFNNWIRDIILQDQQQSGESVDYTEYAVFTMGFFAFVSTGGAKVRQKIREMREAKWPKQQQQPPLTPSGVVSLSRKQSNV